MGTVHALKKPAPLAPDPAGRPLPADQLVEAALLDKLMAPDLATPELSTTLRMLVPEHLFNPANQKVLEVIKALAAEGTTVEPVTVLARLQSSPGPVGGWHAYITGTLPGDGAIAQARPSEYAKILIDRYRAREVVKACAALTDRAYAGTDSDSLVEDARASFGVIADAKVATAGSTAIDALREAWTDLAQSGQRSQRGLTWGWEVANRAFGRLQPGRMTVVAAVPGVGKTNLIWHIAEAVAGDAEDEHGVGEAVYVVEAELKARELVSRQAGIRAGVPPEAVDGDRAMTADELVRLEEAQQDILGLPIVVDDNGGRPFTVAEIESRVRDARGRFAAGTYTTRAGERYPKNRLRLVIVDYLTKLKPPALNIGQRRDSREQEVAAISGALTEMAKVLDVHVLVIATVSRGDKTKTPDDEKRRELKMSDLRESGMIEYDAATIVFMNEPEPGVLRLKNAKQRFRQGSDPVELGMVRGRIFEPDGNR